MFLRAPAAISESAFCCFSSREIKSACKTLCAYKNIMFFLASQNIKFSNFITKTTNKKLNFEYRNVKFSRRHAQVISQLLRGNTAESIAKNLCRSKRTIEKHIEQIRNKLEFRTRSEIISKAFELGFIDLMFIDIL